MNIKVLIKYSRKLPDCTISADKINSISSIDNFITSLKAAIFTLANKTPEEYLSREWESLVTVEYNPLAKPIITKCPMYCDPRSCSMFVKWLRKHMETVIEKHPEQKIIIVQH